MSPDRGMLVTALLIAGALLHTLLAPRLMARWAALRTTPGATLFLWQMVALTGVLCALLAAPVAVVATDQFSGYQPILLGMACAVSALILARVLWSGHRVGFDLRRLLRPSASGAATGRPLCRKEIAMKAIAYAYPKPSAAVDDLT